MESNPSTTLLDSLRFKLSQSRETSRGQKHHQVSKNPSNHNRSKTELIPKDISHRFDTPNPLHSNHSSSEQKLHEILGLPTRNHFLPSNLEDLEKEAKTLLTPKNELPNLETLKQLLNKNNEKYLKKVAEQGGFLYKTQSGLILPQLSSMYEHFTSRRKSNNSTCRADLDLGRPSGRKQVEVIIVWLENMMTTFVSSPLDLSSEERIRRASLINTVCLKEVIRQVSSHCLERGMLLQKIWNAQIDIYDSQDNHKDTQIRLVLEKMNKKIKQKDEKIGELEKVIEKREKEMKEIFDGKDNKINFLNRKIDDLKVQFLHDRQRIIAAVANLNGEGKDSNDLSERRQDQSKIRKTYLKALNPVVMLGYFDKLGFFHKVKVIQEVHGAKVTEDNLDQVVSFVETISQESQTHVKQNQNQYSQTFIPLEICRENDLNILPLFKNSEIFQGRRKRVRSSTCKLTENHKKNKKVLKKSKIVNRSSAAINKNFLEYKSLNISRVSEKSFDGNFESKNKKKSQGEERRSCNAEHHTLQVPSRNSRVYRVKTSECMQESVEGSNKEISRSVSSISNSSNSISHYSHKSKLREKPQLAKKKPRKNFAAIKSNQSSSSSSSKSSCSSKNSSNSKHFATNPIALLKENSELCENPPFNDYKENEVISSELSLFLLSQGQDLSLVESLKNLKSLESLKDLIKILKTYKEPSSFSHQCIQTDLEDLQSTNRDAGTLIPSSESLKNLKNKRTRNRTLSKLKGKKDEVPPIGNLPSVSALDNKVPRTERIRRAGVLITEEFALGQVSKKIQANHPGPKLLSSILSSIRPEGQLKLSLKSLMKIISSVYQEKIFLCKENPINFKSEASMILYDLLMKKYGLKNVAERHFLQVIKSTLAFRPTCFRVQVFSQFLTSESETSRLEDWNFWTFALETVESVAFSKVLLDDGAIEVFCSLPSALQTVSNIFSGKVPEKVLETLQSQVIKMKVANNLGYKRTSTFKIVENVNLDEFLTACLEMYVRCRVKIKEKLWKFDDDEKTLSEEEFFDWVKQFALGPEAEGKLFEKFSNLQKLAEDRLVKTVKVRSLVAIVFENSLIDIKEMF